MHLLTLSCPQLFQAILHMQRTQPSTGMECHLVQLETKNNTNCDINRQYGEEYNYKTDKENGKIHRIMLTHHYMRLCSPVKAAHV